jgi:hypothetical protein
MKNHEKYNDQPLYKQNPREELGYTRVKIPWSTDVIAKAKNHISPISPLLKWHLSAKPEEKAAAKFDLTNWR